MPGNIVKILLFILFVLYIPYSGTAGVLQSNVPWNNCLSIKSVQPGPASVLFAEPSGMQVLHDGVSLLSIGDICDVDDVDDDVFKVAKKHPGHGGKHGAQLITFFLGSECLPAYCNAPLIFSRVLMHELMPGAVLRPGLPENICPPPENV